MPDLSAWAEHLDKPLVLVGFVFLLMIILIKTLIKKDLLSNPALVKLFGQSLFFVLFLGLAVIILGFGLMFKNGTPSAGHPDLSSGVSRVVLENTQNIQNKVILRFLEELKEKEVEFEKRDRVFRELVEKYQAMEERLSNRFPLDKLSESAREKLTEGDLKGAEALLQQSFEQNLQASEKKRKAAAADAFELANLKELQLDYQAARAFYRKTVQLAPQNSTYLLRLGSALHSLGSYEEAIENYSKALLLEIEMAKLGKDDRIALIYSNLGAAWRRLGNLSEAKENHDKALEIELVTFGENDPKVALTYNNLGEIWDAAGKHDKAIEYYEKALKIDLAALKKEHPKVAVLYNNLGEAWRKTGEPEKAIDFFEKALDIYLKEFRKDHPIVATTYNNLGAAWSRLGEIDKAMGYYEKALKIDLAMLGEEHPNVATRYNNIGEIWRKRGEFKKAISYYKMALEIDLAALGETHPNVAIRYNNLGLAWKKLGKSVKARAFYEKALVIFSAQYGPEHASTRSVQSNLKRLENFQS